MSSNPKINRRKMIKKSVLGALGLGVLFSGWEVYSIFKTPNLSEIDASASLIDALTETIIPKTDTPGASEAQVYLFVIYSLKNTVPRKTLNTFIDGLIDIRDTALSQYNMKFEECTLKQRTDLLTPFSNDTFRLSGLPGKVQNKVLGETFFSVLKRLTIQGYCTSKIGATQALAYDPIPVEYHSCIPLVKNQKAWATS